MNRTKDLITTEFWHILTEQPFHTITVRNIVDRCGINRNTFYYHFHDIPELLTTTLESKADEVIRSNGKLGSIQACAEPLIRMVSDNRQAILHIYQSVHRDEFLDNLDRMAIHVVTEYVDTVTEGLEIVPEDRTFIIRVCKCVLVGGILDWLRDNLRYDPMPYVIRINEALQTAERELLQKLTGSGITL